MKKLLTIAIIPAALSLPLSAGTIADSRLGFSITVPDGWYDSLAADSELVFKDRTRTRHGTIGVRLYAIAAQFANAHDWAIDASITYKAMVVSFPYFNQIYIQDSIQQNGLFAMYTNADYSVNPTISEHVRFTGIDRRGYELYATSDYDDMRKYYTDYKGIIGAIFIARGGASVRQAPRVPLSCSKRLSAWCSIDGKIITGFRWIPAATVISRLVAFKPPISDRRANPAVVLVSIRQTN
jgi:hypothetical protein